VALKALEMAIPDCIQGTKGLDALDEAFAELRRVIQAQRDGTDQSTA
jgi:hypothetical protein